MKPAGEFALQLKGMPLTERSGAILERLRASLAELLGRDVTAVSGDLVFPWARSAIASAVAPRSGASDEQFIGVLCRSAKQTIGLVVYPGEVAARVSLRDLAEYLANEFEEPDWTTPRPGAASAARIPPRPTTAAAGARVPNVGFVVSSPRAGSTLLRVMLHGHPDIFSPPELNLLPFESMGQRAAWFQQHGFGWMDRGVVATVAALGRMSPQQAQAQVRAWEHADAPVADVYRGLHGAAKRALLVDKSPLYAADASFLQPAGDRFHEARYIHLVRHPSAVIDSLVRMRFHRLYGPAWPEWHPSPWKYAENCWRQMNENIRTFLRDVPPSRVCVVRFEDLLTDLEGTCSTMCGALGVGFHQALLTPYDGDRLTHQGDGRRTLGDLHFLDHGRIDPDRATSWQRVKLPITLDAKTVELARDFGYET